MRKSFAAIPFSAMVSVLALVDWRIGVLAIVGAKLRGKIPFITALIATGMVFLSYTHTVKRTSWIANLPPGNYLGYGQVQSSSTASFNQRAKVMLESGYKVIAVLPKYPNLAKGTEIRLVGNLRHVDRSDPYEQNYFHDGYYGYLENAQILELKEPGLTEVDVCVNLNQISAYQFGNLLCGVTVGHYKLAKSTEDLFRSIGLTHILAVSGYNVTVIIAILAKLAGRLHRKTIYLVVPILLIGYLQLVGVDNIPASRAVLMGIFTILAQASGRAGSIWLSLIYANLLLFWENPYVYGSISWQLSITALLGILLLTERLSLKLTLVPAVFRQELCVSLAASIATAPIILIHFGNLSPVAPIANLIVAPLIPLLMLLAFVVIAAGWVSPIAQTLLWLVEPFWQMLLVILGEIAKHQFKTIGFFISVCFAVFVYKKIYQNHDKKN